MELRFASCTRPAGGGGVPRDRMEFGSSRVARDDEEKGKRRQCEWEARLEAVRFEESKGGQDVATGMSRDDAEDRTCRWCWKLDLSVAG